METRGQTEKAFEILLVEDRDDDAELARYAFRKVPVPFNFFCQIIKTFTDIWLSGGKPVPVLSGGWTATMFPVTNSST